MEIIFWLSILGGLYSYLFYPLILLLLPRRGRRTGSPAVETESVTIIITAYNEESRIRKKIENTLAIDYPRDRLQVLVASDSSTDGTDRIAEEFREQGVQLVRAPERKGKEYAQLLAIREAHGDVLVFTDTGTEIPVEGLHSLMRNFTDPQVGAVSSEDRFVSRDGSLVGEGAYVKYEMWLRRVESEHAGLVGLSGSFFAARRRVCDLWDIGAPSDFNTAISCARSGLVAVTDPQVIGYYTDIKDESKEYPRKLRTVLRGISGLARHLDVLNPFRYGFFSFQVWGHKVMRWLVPWFLLSALLSSVLLWAVHPAYRWLVVLQMLGYLLLAAAHWVRRLRRNKLLRIGYYFIQVNIAIAHATLLYLAGQRMTVWEPSKR